MSEKPMEVKIVLAVAKLKIGVDYDDEEKELYAVIQLKAKAHPADLARIFNLQRAESPLTCIIGSTQAEFDLRIEQVDKEGEVQPLADRNLIGK